LFEITAKQRYLQGAIRQASNTGGLTYLLAIVLTGAGRQLCYCSASLIRLPTCLIHIH